MTFSSLLPWSMPLVDNQSIRKKNSKRVGHESIKSITRVEYIGAYVVFWEILKTMAVHSMSASGYWARIKPNGFSGYLPNLPSREKEWLFFHLYVSVKATHTIYLFVNYPSNFPGPPKK